jgi:flagellar basal-body rod protein FlgB
MPIQDLFGSTIRVLEQSLDLRQQRQQVIASNIANAQTPGYIPARLPFEAGLKQAEQAQPGAAGLTHPGHIPLKGSSAAPRVERLADQAGIGDGNGVSLDQEMVDLAENQILFEAGAQMIGQKLGLLKYIAGDGR